MKLNKIAIVLFVLLLPVFINAQENKDIITQITENSVTFTIPNIVLDNNEVSAIKTAIQKEIAKQQKQYQEETKEHNGCDLNFCQKIKADDIVCDDKYIYALNTRDAYDNDYGPYYYTEWKITQYLKSSGEIVAETNYMEGLGIFSTFKELEAQKDFRPVKECKLTQLAFEAMQKQEDLK